MQKPKLRLEQIWPNPNSGSRRHRNSQLDGREQTKKTPLEEGQPTTSLARSSGRLLTRPEGSYYLRRGWSLLVRSVYLTRVLERMEHGYRDGGERFFSNLALVWVSRDGSRECALKGKALRELVFES